MVGFELLISVSVLALTVMVMSLGVALSRVSQRTVRRLTLEIPTSNGNSFIVNATQLLLDGPT